MSDGGEGRVRDENQFNQYIGTDRKRYLKPSTRSISNRGPGKANAPIRSIRRQACFGWVLLRRRADTSTLASILDNVPASLPHHRSVIGKTPSAQATQRLLYLHLMFSLFCQLSLQQVRFFDFLCPAPSSRFIVSAESVDLLGGFEDLLQRLALNTKKRNKNPRYASRGNSFAPRTKLGWVRQLCAHFSGISRCGHCWRCPRPPRSQVEPR